MSHCVPLSFIHTSVKITVPHTLVSMKTDLSTARLTDLSCGNDVLVFRVLVDSQTEDVVSVFQVEALGSCRDRKQEA